MSFVTMLTTMFSVHICIIDETHAMSIFSICVRFCNRPGTTLGCMLFAFEIFLEYFCLGCIINVDVNLCDYVMATLHDMARIKYVST